MSTSASPMGQPLSRVDGPLKVSGRAQYAGEFGLPDLLYGSVVNSTIARGRIRSIDTSQAEAVPGVKLVLTHENRPPIASYDEPYEDEDAADGSPFRPLFNDRVLYSGQPIALVVADNLELARYAGTLVRVEYDAESHQTDLLSNLERNHAAPAELPEPRGDAQAEHSRPSSVRDAEIVTVPKVGTPVGAVGADVGADPAPLLLQRYVSLQALQDSSLNSQPTPSSQL